MRDCILNHLTQTQDLNCASTCIAMILNGDVGEVTEEFHDKYVGQEMEVWEYLDAQGIKYRRCMADERKLKGDHVYIMSVPSVNIPSGNHYIVVQMTDDAKNWYILDPNKGKEGRKVYGEDTDINGWTPSFEFKIEDLLEYWS